MREIDIHRMPKQGYAPPSEEACESRRWYRPIRSSAGKPIPGVRSYHQTWKQGGMLCKFFDSIVIASTRDPSWDRDWHLAETDCDHYCCHIHPNGHTPPSLRREYAIVLYELAKRADVNPAREMADDLNVTIGVRVGDLLEKGVSDERTITETVLRCTRRALGLRV